MEPGRSPRPLDKHSLDTFAFKGEINIHYSEVDDHTPNNIRKPLMSGGRGRGKGVYKPRIKTSIFDHDSVELEMSTEPTFDIDSQDEFPSLTSMGRGKPS